MDEVTVQNVYTFSERKSRAISVSARPGGDPLPCDYMYFGQLSINISQQRYRDLYIAIDMRSFGGRRISLENIKREHLSKIVILH